MDDWCKVCGRSEFNHGAAIHEFKSAFDTAFPKLKEEDMSNVSSIAKTLEDTIDKEGFVDIGSGTAEYYGFSEDSLRKAIVRLEQRGYKSQALKVQQIGTDNFVTLTVLAGPDFRYRDVFNKVNNKHVEIELPADASVSETRTAMDKLRESKRQELTTKSLEMKHEGRSNRAIAQALGISETTVRNILKDTPPRTDLEVELESLLNKCSAENGSNTPDFILANYLMACLRAFNSATNRRDEWRRKE